MIRLYNNIMRTAESELPVICIEPDLQLNSLLDVITYGKYNPNCRNKQIVSRKTNNFVKFYIMIKHLDNINGYYPICLSDLYNKGVFEELGYFEVSPKLPSLTSDLTLQLINSDSTHYKLYINGNAISDDYIDITTGFTTAPYLFSNDNNITVKLYKNIGNTKIFIDEYKLLVNITSTNLTSGVLVKAI